MHVPIQKINEDQKQVIIDDLKLLIEQPSAVHSPPCPNCKDFKSSGSHKRDCSPDCERASQALSEDPDRYPIEENVVPLVFELTTMRLVHTCWSCEGHLNIDGEIWKLPQVSFYSDRPIYAQLLSNYLGHLHWKKITHYLWEIALTNYGRLWEVTYTIKCDLSHVKRPDIHLMQVDLRNMAESLSKNLKEEAKRLIYKLETDAKSSATEKQ